MLPSPALSSLSRTLLLVWALLLALGAARAQAADFRDPPNQTFTIWPNIPVIRATDFADYAGDRKIFEDLHNAKGDPATLVAALQAVDALQQHHERAALLFGFYFHNPEPLLNRVDDLKLFETYGKEPAKASKFAFFLVALPPAEGYVCPDSMGATAHEFFGKHIQTR